MKYKKTDVVGMLWCIYYECEISDMCSIKGRIQKLLSANPYLHQQQIFVSNDCIVKKIWSLSDIYYFSV